MAKATDCLAGVGRAGRAGALERELIAIASGPGAGTRKNLARMKQLQAELDREETRTSTPELADLADTSKHQVQDKILSALLSANYSEEEAHEIAATVCQPVADTALDHASGLVSLIMSSLDRAGRKGASLRYALGLAMVGGTLRSAALQLGCTPQYLSQLAAQYKQAIAQERTDIVNQSHTPPRGYLTAPEIGHRLKISTDLVGQLHRAGILPGKPHGRGYVYSKANLNAALRKRALARCSWYELLRRAAKETKGDSGDSTGGTTKTRGINAGARVALLRKIAGPPPRA
jgi:hypothetical protein